VIVFETTSNNERPSPSFEATMMWNRSGPTSHTSLIARQ
jgi:hypothetical protein